MFCTKCGTQLPDDVQFCTHCGALVEKDRGTDAQATQVVMPPAQSAAQVAPVFIDPPLSSGIPTDPVTAQQPAPKKRGGLIAVMAVVIIVIIGAIIFVVFDPLGLFVNKSTSSTETSHSAEDVAKQESPVVTQNASGSIRIEMPAKYADLGYEWDVSSSTELRLKNKDGLTAVIIYQGEITLSYEEARAEFFGLGQTRVNNFDAPINMKVLFWQDSSAGLAIVHGSESSSSGRSSLDIIGITPEELASWVFLEEEGSYNKASISEPLRGSAGTVQSPTSASSHKPFYGIWIGAFSEKWRAENYCNEAISKGFKAQIFLSSDWTNLNQNPYWVVAAMVSDTQSGAETYLNTVKNAGFSEAYVKYSGDYKG